MKAPTDYPEDRQVLSRSKVVNLKKQLANILQHRGMTAAELSRKSGVPKQALSRWLGGQAPKDVTQVKKVADVLGVTLDHLLFGTSVDDDTRKITDISSLVGDDWLGGVFELRLRRVKKNGKE